MVLRIVSLNAWGGRLHAPLMAYLADADPDVLCLQEVVRTPATSLDRLTYRDGDIRLAQRANLYDELCSLFAEHDGFFCPTARGELFDDDGNAIQSGFGLATFVRKSLPVLAQAQHFVHGEYAPDGWGPHPRARNAHCLRLYDHEQKFAFTVAQFHGLRDPAGKHDTPARKEQAGALVRLVESVRHKDERLVVCGDFNVLPGSRIFDDLRQLGLTDLVTSRGFTDTRTSYYEKTPRYADYMLVTPQVEVVQFDAVAKPEVSDHRALQLDMK